MKIEETMSDSALFKDKKVLVFGVANDRSLAWGIAHELSKHGANFGFTYQGEVLEKRVRPLAESVNADFVVPCDVTQPEDIAAVMKEAETRWGRIDVLVHAVAYANREDLDGRFLDTTRDGFLKAMEISAFSLVNLTKAAEQLLTKCQGNVVTLSYYGSSKVVPNYNVMGVAKAALEASVRYLAAELGPTGVRVNAISAGPVKTLAASGVKGFRTMLGIAADRAPLRRNITLEEVGRAAVYLCSSLGSGVTGEVHYVDAGYNIVAM